MNGPCREAVKALFPEAFQAAEEARAKQLAWNQEVLQGEEGGAQGAGNGDQGQRKLPGTPGPAAGHMNR